MDTNSPVLKFASNDHIEIETRSPDGPVLHVGHNNVSFSKVTLTPGETVGLIAELLVALGDAVRISPRAKHLRLEVGWGPDDASAFSSMQGREFGIVND